MLKETRILDKGIFDSVRVDHSVMSADSAHRKHSGKINFLREIAVMAQKAYSLLAAVLLLNLLSVGCQQSALSEQSKDIKRIVTSDTLLSGMNEALLPSEHFEITAILPPGQCPGHYDIKLTDIAKVKRAVLVVCFEIKMRRRT